MVGISNICSTVNYIFYSFAAVDFGIVLGCRLFIKEVTNRSLIDKDNSLRDGDIIMKVI